MSDGLFHIDQHGRLASLRVTPYATEDALQYLLETHPDLLAGGQMTPEVPRRWALIKREHGVPDREDAGSRWSVDHLFVDQDGVPTLVEVKRSSDTRIRREVVGQMLDYAANGVRYWPGADLQAAFEQTQVDLGQDPVEVLADLTTDPATGLDEFFVKVADNLRAGRLRMVFVADLVPDELRRITEFLNEQMSPAEVYAVEVKTYRTDSQPDMVIVPTVYGRTAAASVKTSKRRPGDRAAALAASNSSTLQIEQRITEFAAAGGLMVIETPAGALLKTPGRGSIANLYFASFDSLEFPLQPMRDRGWVAEADRILAELRSLTSKQLTEKNPTVPSEDALAGWDTVEKIFNEVANLYLTHESAASPPA